MIMQRLSLQMQETLISARPEMTLAARILISMIFVNDHPSFYFFHGFVLHESASFTAGIFFLSPPHGIH
ncbi:hypothetical protein HYF16_004733 [Salmonella enterica]|nr:hypothetical protein [Salmonella enterica]EHF6859196.1 hypothetical protein [Salmonella enterica subsp. enterica serovar Panama]EHJ0806550.1 hypothetical protein [Salmonella enterica]EHY9249689.1 hypothetical protein [Salmonella enterica]ELS1935911.1 hypothetical protein [Salmonella enterica]